MTTSSVSTLINPATEEVLRTVEQLDVPAVDDAVARAKSAQKFPRPTSTILSIPAGARPIRWATIPGKC